ncbi:MAG: endonuclease [Planctomycetes bacterium]|nr:endonuclease [Planctomycetota bacterium]
MGRLFISCLCALASAQGLCGQQAYVECWVRTKCSGAGFPALLTNKDWSSGKVHDYTTHHAYGSSRTSGKLRGYAFALQPNGSWTFNLGDGKSRIDYRPTATRQPVNDGKQHMLVASLDATRKECRLYYDGQNVAIYSTAGFGDTASGTATKKGDGVTAVQRKVASSDEAVALAWREKTGQVVRNGLAATHVDTVRVLAWNIWHGGRRDGNEVGIQKTVEAIKDSAADVICMQETYGSGPAIADALGYYFYLRSTNLSLMSRYPIRETFDLYQSFRFGGAAVELSTGQRIKFFSLWINHLPSIGAQMKADDTTADSLAAADDKTRGREIRGILQALAPHTKTADATPVVVAGDFNSPSHLDWAEGTADRHKGLVVSWPVSTAMARAGYADTFRAVHPDPAKVVARTWSPRFTASYQMRIDYIYCKGRSLRAKAGRMLDNHAQRWPSDHAAVVVELAVATTQPRK